MALTSKLNYDRDLNSVFHRMIIRTGTLLVAILAGMVSAPGFLPPTDTAGPLTLTIENPGEVNALGEPHPLKVTLKNSGPTRLEGTVKLAVIDDWRIEGPASKKFSVESNSAEELAFRVIPGKRSHAALYPVHAFADFRNGSVPLTAHAILITSVSAPAVAAANPVADRLPELKLPANGRVRLDAAGVFRPRFTAQGMDPAQRPVGWQDSDEGSGASVQLLNVDRGQMRHAIGMHPPWRKAWGDVSVDYVVKLPDQKPITLVFATAIRDHSKDEPPSDGVEFTVLVSDGGAFKPLFSRFSASKQWEPATVDLSACAGRTVTIRLMSGPGPEHNTVCDQSYWAGPLLVAGQMAKPEAESNRLARRRQALELARNALLGKPSPWSWKLVSEAATTGAAIVPGPCGIADAFIAFVDDRNELVFDGFMVEIDGWAVGTKLADLPCEKVKTDFAAGRGTISTLVTRDNGTPLAVQSSVWAERGALRIAFEMPGVKRDPRGEPRFSALAIGPASELARRVYAGFGNVIQNPGAFDLPAGGFWLSTRHIGMDFQNGLSLVQASDIFPDRFHVDPERRTYSLVAHHDAIFSFVPSSRQAFAAARVYRGLAGFKPAGGVENLLGRFCLDQWGGNYRRAAEDLERAARYGVTDAVFVKHVWQRWGYDYRLPDIFPPEGSFEEFSEIAKACKQHGILFAPHDNYIDFYPDATGFSYEHISFTADGNPHKAWLNKGRDALSYRWSPLAFGPWLESNLKQIRSAFAPTAYFVDVFGSIPPEDFYDHSGRFHPKSVTAERWGGAFDRIREILGNQAPMISETGHDGLIGHLDGGEADHSAWLPDIQEPEVFRWDMKADDGERVPWHDMASHGSFVLLGGGLGSRYAGGQNEILHGYGSDDYLSLTVLGGRNPMCDGPFSRRTVMTYWLLHDVCNALAHDEMLSHEFVDDDIHRQITRFSNDHQVKVNRGKTDWAVDGQVLPPFGFIAKTGSGVADVTRRQGVISASAKSPGALFVDARPNVSDPGGQVLAKVTGVEDLGGRRFRFWIDWEVSQAVPSGFQPFIHFVDVKRPLGEGILFQGAVDLDPQKLQAIGTYSSTGEVNIPADIAPQTEVAIRFGLFRPEPDGRRLPMLVPMDSSGRVRGGTIRLQNGNFEWSPEPPDPAVAALTRRLNMSGKLVDFGAAATNGAFRLLHGSTHWQLIPLPGSAAFNVELRLDQLGADNRKVQGITATDSAGIAGAEVGFDQDGDAVRFETSSKDFAYHITFAPSAVPSGNAGW